LESLFPEQQPVAPPTPDQPVAPISAAKISKRKAKAVTPDDSDNDYANSDEERYAFGSVHTLKFNCDYQ
jgi:hypothetical protein